MDTTRQSASMSRDKQANVGNNFRRATKTKTQTMVALRLRPCSSITYPLSAAKTCTSFGPGLSQPRSYLRPSASMCQLKWSFPTPCVSDFSVLPVSAKISPTFSILFRAPYHLYLIALFSSWYFQPGDIWCLLQSLAFLPH